MSLFNMKSTEDEMYSMLEELLLPGEQLEACVTAMIYPTGFFATRYPSAGYIGLTDSGRLVGWAMHLAGNERLAVDFAYVTKINMRKPLISGKLAGQRDIFIYYNDGKKQQMHFLMQEKVGGNKFPNQAENVQRIADELEYLRSTLPNK